MWKFVVEERVRKETEQNLSVELGDFGGRKRRAIAQWTTAAVPGIQWSATMRQPTGSPRRYVLLWYNTTTTTTKRKRKKKKTSKFSQFSKHKIKNNYKIGRLIITECDKIRSITIWEVSEDVNENGFINTKNPSASPPESSKTISPPARVVVGILDKWDVDGETLQDLDKNSKEESRGVWVVGRDMAAAATAEIEMKKQTKKEKKKRNKEKIKGKKKRGD